MNAIRALRKNLNMSQDEFAKLIGCEQPTVWRMEHGQEPSGPIKILLRMIEDDFQNGKIKARPPRDRRIGFKEARPSPQHNGHSDPQSRSRE